MISLTYRPLPDNTQHSQETDIHAPGGIRTCNPSKRAAADPHLRSRSHWDRLTVFIKYKICPYPELHESSPHPFFISILILYSHLRLDLLNGLRPSRFPIKTPKHFSSLHVNLIIPNSITPSVEEHKYYVWATRHLSVHTASHSRRHWSRYSGCLYPSSKSVLLKTFFLRCRAVAQAVSRQPRPQSQASPRGICDGHSGTRTGSSPSTSVFPGQYHSTNAAYSFIYHGRHITLATDSIVK
jgi:hypothetical protein